MNYCFVNERATEKCECYNIIDLTEPPAVLESCEVGQFCAYIGDYPKQLRMQCLDLCAPGQVGPCACDQNGSRYEYIYPEQVCMSGTSFAASFAVLPVAAFDKLLQQTSACQVRAGASPEWDVCEFGKLCGRLVSSTSSTAKCLNLCPINSVVGETCFCKDSNGVNTLAQSGQYCTEMGAVTEYTAPICPENSFSTGNCKCAAADAANCAAGNVCIQYRGAISCMRACERDYNTNTGDCACRGLHSAVVVEDGNKCVFDDAGEPADLDMPKCLFGQIGPCACPDFASQSLAVHFFYTNHNSACFEHTPINGKNTLPLMEIRTQATQYSACQITPAQPTDAVICEPGRYCVQTGLMTVECIEKCQPDMTAVQRCACATSDGIHASFAEIGDLCSANGRIIRQSGDLCVPNALSLGDCKCYQDDQQPCPRFEYCINILGTQRCMQNCLHTDDYMRGGCVCPYSASTTPIPKNLVCACTTRDYGAACEAILPCNLNQIGPCACGQIDGMPFAFKMQASQVCIKNSNEQLTVLMLCKSNVIANKECGCKKDGAGFYMKKDYACMRNLDYPTEMVKKCAIGVVAQQMCACRVSNDAGAAVYCEQGSTCKQDPNNSGQNVCWRQCIADKQCPIGGKCIGVGDDAHCISSCAFNQIITHSSECFCGAGQLLICKAPFACVQSNGPKCVDKCQVNTVSNNTCYCVQDGAGADTSILVTEPSVICVQTDAKKLLNDVKPLCTATLQNDCACQLKATSPTVLYTNAQQACVGGNGEFTFYEACENVSDPKSVCSCSSLYNAALCIKMTCYIYPNNPAYKVCQDGCDLNTELNRKCFCGTAMCQAGQICNGTVCSDVSLLKSSASAGNLFAAVMAVTAAVVVVAVVVGIWFALRRNAAKVHQQAQQNCEVECGQIPAVAAQADN